MVGKIVNNQLKPITSKYNPLIKLSEDNPYSMVKFMVFRILSDILAQNCCSANPTGWRTCGQSFRIGNISN